MRNGIAGHELVRFDLTESTGIVASLARELILLIVGNPVEDRDPVISSPAEQKVFIGIDPRAIFNRLLKGCEELDVILHRNNKVFFLDRTRRHQQSGYSQI